MTSIYSYDGKSDIGYQKSINEDFIDAVELDERTLLLFVADGTNSDPDGGLQPASIAIHEMGTMLKRIFEKSASAFLMNPELFLTEAFEFANRILMVFTAANKDRFAGFGCSLACCLIYQKENQTCATVVNAGNTRFYLIRLTKGTPAIHQLTTDHTRASDMVLTGQISEEEYYSHLDRLVLTSGLGILPEPKLQILDNLYIKKNDILLMTTDGIHYAIRPEALSDIVLQSGTCSDAAKSLIEAAKIEKYPANMSALIAYIP